MTAAVVPETELTFLGTDDGQVAAAVASFCPLDVLGTRDPLDEPGFFCCMCIPDIDSLQGGGGPGAMVPLPDVMAECNESLRGGFTCKEGTGAVPWSSPLINTMGSSC